VILLDNSVSPGLIVSLSVKTEDDMIATIDRYQAATGKQFDIDWLSNGDVAVLYAETPQVLGNFPSRPSMYVEAPVIIPYVLPEGVTTEGKSPEILALEAEAYRVIAAKAIGVTPKDE